MKVLLATDGSPHAENAAAFLCRLPHAEPLELTVMTNVFIPAATTSFGTDSWIPEFRQQQHAAAKAHFETVAQMFEGANAEIEHHVSDGDIGHSIIEKSQEMNAELIVLGAKGHSMIDRILLGSVSDYVATEARCSVLIVRPSNKPSSDRERLDVTVSADPDAPTDALVAPFRRFHFGETVCGHVLSVVPVIRTFRQDLLPAVAMNRAEEHSLALAHATRLADEIAKEDVRLVPKAVESEHVGEAVIRFIEEHRSDLVLVGDSHRGAVSRLALGSTSRYILRHSECSVWIAREKKKT